MLLHRVITAVLLVIPVLWILLFQPTEILVYMLLVIAFVSSYEWAQLGGVQDRLLRLVFSVFITSITWVLIKYFYQYGIWIVSASAIWWFFIHLYLRKAVPVEKGSIKSVGKLGVAVLVIPAACISMTIVHSSDNGGEWLLYGLALIWVADIGAYFSGKKFGKNKLAPNISPGKTKEGLWGALTATTLYSLVVGLYFELGIVQLTLMIVMSIVLTVISVTGDLYESFLKRESGLKDSGNILPGHGGMLDRIDSVLAAMPVFMLGLLLIAPESI